MEQQSRSKMKSSKHTKGQREELRMNTNTETNPDEQPLTGDKGIGRRNFFKATGLATAALSFGLISRAGAVRARTAAEGSSAASKKPVITGITSIRDPISKAKKPASPGLYQGCAGAVLIPQLAGRRRRLGLLQHAHPGSFQLRPCRAGGEDPGTQTEY